jgi:hypothetical protein
MSTDLSSFDNIMRCAVNIKTVQLAKKRKSFDNLPIFLQAGLYLYSKFQNVRNQEFDPKIWVFEILKNDGNSLFSESQYQRAARKYEEVGNF